MLLANLSMRWALRGTRTFRQQLLKEMMAACSIAEAQRVAQLKTLEEKLQLSLSQESCRPSQTSRFHEAFGCVPVSETTHLYTKRNRAGRPHQVWKCETGAEKDVLLFEEVNEGSTVDVALTRDGQLVTINSNTRTSSEVHILKADELAAPPLLIRPREERLEYYMDHAHNQFYVFTNLGSQRDYKVMVARDADPTNWQDYYSPKGGFVLQDMELFEKYIVLYGSKDLVPVVIVMRSDQNNDNNQKQLELYCEDACHIDKSDSLEFKTGNLHFWLSSPTMPSRLYYCNGQEIKSCSNMNNWIPKHITERITATSEDGTQIPMTLVYSKGLRRDGGNPVLVHVYGCYGENVYMGFRPENVCLLNRGWILAYCHVRGGSELGRRWYHAGQGRSKHKTFEDLHACVQHLHREGFSKPGRTALYGKSAGGMAVGMFCNQWPEMIQAAVLQVPFVNVIDSLLDASLYLSAKDYEEFGNPDDSAEELHHIRSICPYSTLKPQDFPSVLVSASKTDAVVPFAGVQKYVSRLKQCLQDHRGGQPWVLSRPSRIPRGTIVFHIDRQHGHHGSADMQDKFKQVAVRIAFIYRALGLDIDS